MNLLPSEPQTISQNIYDTFRVWSKSFFATLPFMIFLCIAVSFTSFFATYIPSKISLKLLWLICACFIIILYVIYAAIYHRIYSIIYNKKDSLIYAFYVGIKKFIFLIIATFVTLFVLALLVIAISIPFFIIFYLLSYHMPDIWPLHQMLLKPRLELLASVTAVFAYIYAAVLLMFYFPLIIVDNLNPFVAFSKSVYLVWGNWWRTAIIIGVMYAIIPICLYLIEWYLVYHLGANYLSTLQQWILSDILQNIISIFYVPLFVSAVLVVLHDLKIRKHVNMAWTP